MSNFIWPSIGLYSVFGIFVYYQQLHAKSFQGSNQLFGALLALSAIAGTVTGVVYLGFYAWHVAWWAALVVFLLGMVGTVAGVLIERVTGPHVLSLGGFLGWPVAAYFMFEMLPRSS